MPPVHAVRHHILTAAEDVITTTRVLHLEALPPEVFARGVSGMPAICVATRSHQESPIWGCPAAILGNIRWHMR